MNTLLLVLLSIYLIMGIIIGLQYAIVSIAFSNEPLWKVSLRSLFMIIAWGLIYLGVEFPFLDL